MHFLTLLLSLPLSSFSCLLVFCTFALLVFFTFAQTKMIGQIIVLDPKKYLLVTRCPLFFQINATFIKIQVPLKICCSKILHLLLPNWYPVLADSHVFSQPSNAKPNSEHSYGWLSWRLSCKPEKAELQLCYLKIEEKKLQDTAISLKIFDIYIL